MVSPLYKKLRYQPRVKLACAGRFLLSDLSEQTEGTPPSLPYTTSMTFNTSHESNGTIVVAPRNEVDQTATVVMCHGLGDTAQGWEDVAEASSWM